LKVVWTAPAGGDLHRITAFYRRIDPELSARMRRRIEAGVKRLTELPNLGSPAPNDKRAKWRIPRSEFLIFFKVWGDTILIEEVLHGRENWRREA